MEQIKRQNSAVRDEPQQRQIWESGDLSMIGAAAWDLLEQGKRDARSPFHTPTLSTVFERQPSARVVVLRKVDNKARKLYCHTDARSAKLCELHVNPRVEWCFYDPLEKVQLRMKATAQVRFGSAQDPLASEQFAGTRLTSRRAYLISEPPGMPLAGPGTALPKCLSERMPTEEESQAGLENFAVIETTIMRLSWLYLRAKGNLAARFAYNEDGTLKEQTWIVP